MEYNSMEKRALKSSFLLKSNSQVFFNDDGWCLNGNNSVSGDDFPVEELLNLDFLDKDFENDSFLQESEEERVFAGDCNSSFLFSASNDFDNPLTGEPVIPVYDLENLEWLSQFVDDSSLEFSLLCPAGSFTDKMKGFSDGQNIQGGSTPVVKQIQVPCFPVPGPGKARSKRMRATGRAWSLTSSTVTTTSSSSYGSPSSGFMNPVQGADCFSSIENPPEKKQKKNPAADNGSFSGGFQVVRRCTHCLVQKTPQWRAGPLGSKTLCNACGVRYKSGRLLPEYRPACSPTFSQEIHSNSHRKVLEMRRKKQLSGPIEPGFTVSDILVLA